MNYYVDTKKLKIKMVNSEIQTITELEKKTNINRNTLSSVISGKKQPSAKVMMALANAFNMDSEEAGRIFFAK